MSSFSVVLFDFGHTLFHPTRIAVVDLRSELATTEAQRLFDEIFDVAWERSRTPEEIGKGRDLSAAAHLDCWLDLLAPLDELSAGLSETTYDFMCSVRGWEPYPDTVEVLAELTSRNVEIGIVSDCGWDIRDVFAQHGLDRFIRSYTLSYELGVCKPSEEVFARTLQELSIEPARTLMVGDTWLTDGGAAAYGVTTLILPNRDRVTEPALRSVLDLVR